MTKTKKCGWVIAVRIFSLSSVLTYGICEEGMTDERKAIRSRFDQKSSLFQGAAGGVKLHW